jgi:hypothetical protein
MTLAKVDKRLPAGEEESSMLFAAEVAVYGCEGRGLRSRIESNERRIVIRIMITCNLPRPNTDQGPSWWKSTGKPS